MLYKNKEWLENKYLNEKLSKVKIAKICNVSRFAIRYHMKKMNIPIRSKSEAHNLARGNHCNLTVEAKQWLNGELLGDGCLVSYSKYSASFAYTSKYLEYIQYVSNTLKSFGIMQSAEIREAIGKQGNVYYQYHSLNYPELLKIKEIFYINNKKIIPKNIDFTPLTLRQWYIGDGGLVYRMSKNNKPQLNIVLYTYGFTKEEVKNAIKKLTNIGFGATQQLSRNIIGISRKSTKDFLEFIGECPVQCYQYKWGIK